MILCNNTAADRHIGRWKINGGTIVRSPFRRRLITSSPLCLSHVGQTSRSTVHHWNSQPVKEKANTCTQKAHLFTDPLFSFALPLWIMHIVISVKSNLWKRKMNWLFADPINIWITCYHTCQFLRLTVVVHFLNEILYFFENSDLLHDQLSSENSVCSDFHFLQRYSCYA